MEAIDHLEHALAKQGWAIEIAVIVFLGVVFNFLFNRFYHFAQPNLHKYNKIWEESVLTSFYRPIKLVVWILVITFCLEVFGEVLKVSAIAKAIRPIRVLGIMGAFLWALLAFSTRVENNLLRSKVREQHSIDETSVQAIGKLMRTFVIITCVLVALQGVGIPISGLIAVGGFGGAAIGFAAKDLLANFFGGLTLHLDRPFSLGDTIRSPDRELEGVVEYIGWRSTRLLTNDKRPLFIPNSLFTTIAIENQSRMTNRRINTKVGIRYEDAPKLSHILKSIHSVIEEHPDIAQDKPIYVYFTEFGTSSLNILVQAFTKTTDMIRFQEIQQDIFLKMIEIVGEHGARISLPVVAVTMPEGLNLKGHLE